MKAGRKQEEYMDTYVEWLVEKKPNPLNTVIRIACYTLTGVFFLAGLFIFAPLFAGGILMLAADFILLPMLDVEYEYLFLQRSLTIDRIYSKEKRKKAAEYELDKMEFFAEEGTDEFLRYKDTAEKKADFTSGYEDRRRFVLIVHDENAIIRVLLEPDDKTVEAIKQLYPSKVFIKRY